MTNVIHITDRLLEDGRIIARCPDCNHDAWYILVDGLGDEWKKITGTMCKNCKFEITWVIAEKD